ncbi:MAG TPA: gliding motility-associated C-terminal domain-containing protein [Saprospiraceae bacterium]|nr:gliding motility-associated C-terminal domain-containing protein [Saprospiraceae bacterium]
MTQVFSQNLVPNPGFEVFTSCPVNINLGQPLECPPWIVPTGGTSDYFNACHTGGIVGVPNNYFGIQPAHTGQAYAGGLYYYQSWVDYREFLQVQLTSPMVAGATYNISLYYSLASFTCPIDKLGILISDTQIIDLSTFGPLNENPQLELNVGLIDNTSWQLYTDCYVALGGEEWITIGNFYHDTEITLGVGCPPFSGMTISYVYIDDVSVEELPPHDPIDLGAPEQILCPGESINFDFDPGLGDFVWQDGSTSSSFVINSPGVYAVTLSTFCGTEEDEVNVIALEPPAPFDLGADTMLCPFDELLLSLDPALGDFSWQDDSTDPSYTVTDSGTYALTISNACGEVFDEINVMFYPEPFVVFNEDTIMLCEGETFVLSLDPEIGEYFWQDGTEGPDYTVTQPGIYSVTVVNPCGSDNTSVVVDYDFEPMIDISADINICPSQLPYTFNLTGLADVEQFLWSDSTTSPTFTINGAGSYGVTVSNDCFEASDVINVSVENAPPIVTLPGDTMLCPGAVLLLNVSNIPGTYAWQDNDTASVYDVMQSGIYSVTVTNTCGVGIDTIDVTYRDFLPALDLGPDLSLCPGEQITIHAGVTGVDFLWMDGSVFDSIIVDEADTVILTISNGCTSDSDTLQISLNANAPEADLPAQLNLCAGDSVTIATSVGGVMYEWNTGMTASSITVLTAGQYILTITNACGMDIDTTDVIDLGTGPVFDLGPDQSICPGDTVMFNPGLAGTYLWQDGSTSNTYEVSQTGQIILMITNACGSAIDTIIVTENSMGPVLELGPDTSVCEGETVLINPGINGVTYLWQDGSTNPSLLVTASAMIILEIANSCGVARDTLDVVISGVAPELELGPDINVCEGETVLVSPGISDVTYLWQDGSTNSSLFVTTSSMIALEITNACGVARDTMDVVIAGIAPQVDLGPDTLLCDGEILVLTVDNTGVIVEWQDGSSGPLHMIEDAGLYTVSLTNLCGVTSDSVTVLTEISPPPFDLGADQLICAGDVITLEAPLTEPGDNLSWSTGSTASSIDVSVAGEYVLMISNVCGSASDMVTIEVNTTELSDVVDNLFTYCDGDQLILNVQQPIPATYLWNNGATGTALTVTQTGTYSVTITAECDQLMEDILVEPGDCVSPNIFIPNVFTPNGDDVNDIFRIEMDDRDLIEFQVWIYDRWGDVVYNSLNPDFEWKGDFNGKELQPGVYVYHMLVSRQIGSTTVPERLKGDVTLIR